MRKLPQNKSSLPKSWFNVAELVREANVQIANSKTVEERLGIAKLLEFVLDKTGNNWGYHRLSVADNSMREYY